MTTCDLERRTDGQPVSEYMWCRSHHQVVQGCLAAKDAEFQRLFADYQAVAKEIDARDGTGHWTVAAGSIEGWREFDKFRASMKEAGP